MPGLSQKRSAPVDLSVPERAASGRGGQLMKLGGIVTLGAAGSFAVAVAALSFTLSGLLLRPRLKRLEHLQSPRMRNLLRKAGFRFDDVTIRSFDGTKLEGWWLPAAEGAPTVVTLHGVRKNRTDVLRVVLVLRAAGFNVLVFDGRGHGNSEGRHITYGFYERRDVESVIDWLIIEKEVDPELLGLAGESMGASIALQVAAHNPRVRAVWADSPFASLRRVTTEFVKRVSHLPDIMVRPLLTPAIMVANFRGKFDFDLVDPLSLASQIKCPVFLVHGTADDLISTDHSERIHEELGGSKEIWIVEGARHARIKRHSRYKQEYAERIVRFFRGSFVGLDGESEDR